MTKYFINLTNGIEALTHTSLDGIDGFIRIESTAGEQKQWWKILYNLDYTFLTHVALGNECIVYDYSNRKESPRAIYQGIEWIKYALNRIWLQQDYKPVVRGNDCTKYFSQVIDQLITCDANQWRDKAIKKLCYYSNSGFVLTREIRIFGVGDQTTHDGDKNYYREILRESVERQ